MALQIDELLQERYRIVRSIKSGGMGAVYEACDTKLADSRCAIKEILEKAQLGDDSEYIQKSFYQEMSSLSKLDHPAIPKVRDYLNTENSIYIVMDLVQGQGLEDELTDMMAMTGQPPAPERVVKDMISLLDTLDYLHGQKSPVVHRDIKPGNVLRDRRTGGIKLVDFGLARRMDQKNTQTIVGTLGYCAPEQLMGKSEPRSDIFSVGMTMAHMITGSQPEMVLFEATRIELPGIRPGLSEILLKATQPKPEQRYSGAKEMMKDLQAWLDAGHNVAPTTPVAEPVLFAIPAVATNLRTGVAPIPAAEPPTEVEPARPNLAAATVAPPPASSWKGIAVAAGICTALGLGLFIGGHRTKSAVPTASKSRVVSGQAAAAPASPPLQVASPPSASASPSAAPRTPTETKRPLAQQAKIEHPLPAAVRPKEPEFRRPPVQQRRPRPADTEPPVVVEMPRQPGGPDYAQYNQSHSQEEHQKTYLQQLAEKAQRRGQNQRPFAQLQQWQSHQRQNQQWQNPQRQNQQRPKFLRRRPQTDY